MTAKKSKKQPARAPAQDVAPPETVAATSSGITLAPGHALVLRVCHADMSSSHGFVWPTAGEVVAPDWEAKKQCGNGLHGWLWGAGSIKSAGAEWGFTEPDVRWLVVDVVLADVIDIDGKVKFPRGTVRFVGNLHDCVEQIAPHAPPGLVAISGTATAGDRGTATAGDSGTATAGDSGTATARDRGTATAGYRGTILIRRWDEALQRYRWVVGEVGIDGIEANVPYILDEHGKLARKPVP